MTKKQSKKKKIKGWVVFHTSNRLPESKKLDLYSLDLGDGSSDYYRIYRRKKDAQNDIYNDNDEIVLPCEITYTIPKKKA